MELRHRHVGGGLLWRAAILGHEQPGCKSAQESHEKTYIYSLKAHGRSFMSKFRAGWEFLQAAVALISSVTCWTRACSAVFISSLQMLVAAACLCSSFYHLIYGPGLPTPYKSILQSLPPHTYKGILRIGFFSPSSLRVLVPVGYLHCTDIVTAAVSSKERKNKSLGSSSLNKVLKQCVHLHFTLWGISALYWASKKRLITLIPIKQRRKKRIRNEKWQ